jgi:FMN phosphatase YigB (HAD superfamily)
VLIALFAVALILFKNTGNINFDQFQIDRISDVFKELGIYIGQQEARDFYCAYSKIYEDSWMLFHDVIPCLEELKKAYKMGMITNGNQFQQTRKLEKLGIYKYFDLIRAC